MTADDPTIRRILEGDAEAFGCLVQRHESMVKSVCRRMLSDEHEALDAAQDAFVRAYLNLGQLKDPAAFPAWLARVAASVCLNKLKSAGRQIASFEQLDPATLTADQPDPAHAAQNRELADAVLRCIAALPDRYRQPIEMYYLQGAEIPDIARRLGLRAGAVRTRLSRARDLLRPSLAHHWPVETLSRTKQLRPWLPRRLEPRENHPMKLTHPSTRRTLPRGDAEITIRPMTRRDLSALRAFDNELTGQIDQINASFPPGGHSTAPGGPWSDDQWLAEHFDKYQRHGGLTLLAVEDSGRVVGFADLWPADEPHPFGPSLDVECIDYFRDYFLAGLETSLLAEAEKVARDAGLPALDIGTNTCSGEYVSLRRFGLQVFYEYDAVFCRCARRAGHEASIRRLDPKDVDLAGLVKVDHWSPTGFTFRSCDQPTCLAELTWPNQRAVVELWHFRDGEDSPPVSMVPNRCELYAPPDMLTSTRLMTDALAASASLAAELGARQIELPCPSNLTLDSDKLDVLTRQFAFAWLRKSL
ncbi:MAG: sigma-70 family RNA polymerase sigma factor [Phycisphaeraceae bacterium]|nr:sigma-70 family RNA polymerase sigma factor [Phycisphaeraceae bacterium]